MQIQISWLLQKPTDLNLHCLQRQGVSGFGSTRINIEKEAAHREISTVTFADRETLDLADDPNNLAMHHRSYEQST